jgi:plasmid stabilization system protein ParE
VARVVVTPAALDDLERLIRTHSLPVDTRERVRRSLRPLERFPLLGSELEGRWSGFRFLLGPWRWMIVVYVYDVAEDRVAIVTVQDGRAAISPTAPA